MAIEHKGRWSCSQARLFREAFTLLELMAGLSVIALLVSLLLPVLSATTERKKTAVCISNLRQWGIAVNLYTGEHNGNFPSGDPKANEHNNNGLFALASLSEYVGAKVTTATKGTPRGFPTCPARDQAHTEWHQGNYAWNPYVLSAPVSSAVYGLYPRLSALEQPKILMADANLKHTLGYYEYVRSPNAPNPGWPFQIKYRHGKSANILWSDGRVESTTTNTIGHQNWFTRP